METVLEKKEVLKIPAWDGIDFHDIIYLRKLAKMYKREKESIKEFRKFTGKNE